MRSSQIASLLKHIGFEVHPCCVACIGASFLFKAETLSFACRCHTWFSHQSFCGCLCLKNKTQTLKSNCVEAGCYKVVIGPSARSEVFGITVYFLIILRHEWLCPVMTPHLLLYYGQPKGRAVGSKQFLKKRLSQALGNKLAWVEDSLSRQIAYPFWPLTPIPKCFPISFSPNNKQKTKQSRKHLDKSE